MKVLALLPGFFSRRVGSLFFRFFFPVFKIRFGSIWLRCRGELPSALKVVEVAIYGMDGWAGLAPLHQAGKSSLGPPPSIEMQDGPLEHIRHS